MTGPDMAMVGVEDFVNVAVGGMTTAEMGFDGGRHGIRWGGRAIEWVGQEIR